MCATRDVDRSAAGVGEHAVEGLGVALGGDGLAQVCAQLVVAAAGCCVGGAYAPCEDVGVQPLAAVGRQCVVEEVAPLYRVALQVAEAQVEVVVEAVAGHRRVAPGHGLAHLEGRGEELCVADHRHGNVAHEHGSHDGVCPQGMEALQLGAYAVGHAPAVLDGIYAKSLHLFQCAGIGCHLALCLSVALGVDDDGKAVACGGCAGGACHACQQ